MRKDRALATGDEKPKKPENEGPFWHDVSCCAAVASGAYFRNLALAGFFARNFTNFNQYANTLGRQINENHPKPNRY